MKANKALLVGNGFTSQLIPSLSSSELMKRMWEQLPEEMTMLESFSSRLESLENLMRLDLLGTLWIQSGNINQLFGMMKTAILVSERTRSILSVCLMKRKKNTSI